LTPTWDKTAGVKWITWDSNQWVSYDDADTFSQKKVRLCALTSDLIVCSHHAQDFATNRCLGGLMLWAIDQMDQTASNGLGFAPGITQAQQNDANQMSKDQAAKLSCYTTDCNEKCNKGTNQVAQMNGQPGQLSTK
jgi:chitinase